MPENQEQIKPRVCSRKKSRKRREEIYKIGNGQIIERKKPEDGFSKGQ